MISPNFGISASKMWGEERQVGWQEEMIFRFLEKMIGAREKNFAVSSLNDLRAFIRGGLARQKNTQIPRDIKKSCTSKPLSQNAISRGI